MLRLIIACDLVSTRFVNNFLISISDAILSDGIVLPINFFTTTHKLFYDQEIQKLFTNETATK